MYDFIKRYYDDLHPALFSEINTVVWPIIVFFIVIILIAAEVAYQKPQNTNNSNNAKNPTTNIDEVINNNNLNHNVVGWRRAMLLSIFLSLIVLIGFYAEFPDGYDFFLVAVILFIVIYLFSVWFQWNWWKPKDTIIESELLKIRHKIKDIEINNFNLNGV